MSLLTAKQLRALLQTVPDEALIVTTGTDHSLRSLIPEVTTALQDRRVLTEDHGEAVTPEAEYGKRVPVLLLR